VVLGEIKGGLKVGSKLDFNQRILGSLGIRLVAKMSNKQNPCCAMILPDG
jgi:hypothetical protein